MHTWGTEGVDWEGISDAAFFIAVNLRRFGRIGVRDWKEKWGTVRVYCDLGWHSLLSITHPGWMHYGRYPKWLMHLDIFWLPKLIGPLNRIVVPWHKLVYRQVYKRALKRWPHLAEEILVAADWPELLEGLHPCQAKWKALQEMAELTQELEKQDEH